MNAQETICGNDLLDTLNLNNPYLESSLNYSGSIDPNYLSTFEPVVYNIFFWQVSDPSGQFDDPLTESDALTAVAMLNIEYNQYNIFFKYRGYNSFNSEDNQPVYYYDTSGPTASCEELLDGNGNPVIDPEGYSDLHGCEVSKLLDYAKSIGKWKDDAFNVYVPNSSPSFSGLARPLLTESYIVKSRLTTTTLIHEIGHNFNLSHTHHNFETSPNCEHVTRDPTLECEPNPPYTVPCFNALSTGDRVLDTAAVPSFYHEFCFFDGQPLDCGQNIYYNIEECNYIGFNNDCQGTLYDIDESDVRNYMSYSPPDECRNSFSIGQAIRMRESIVWDPATSFDLVETEIRSLYEPYKGVYSETGLLGPDILPHFQPGFDYAFRKCSPYGAYPPPIDYYDTSFLLEVNQGAPRYDISKNIAPEDYGQIVHLNNYAITIEQLVLYDTRPARCCYSVEGDDATDGAVIKFNDGVFNNNITVTPQDSTAINNPNLINDLEPGLYKIEKVYLDGSTQETVILKENNE